MTNAFWLSIVWVIADSLLGFGISALFSGWLRLSRRLFLIPYVVLTSAFLFLSTYRTGETLPDNMKPGFTLSYVVTGADQMATALATALQEELETQTSVGTAEDASNLSQQNKHAPYLLVELSSDRLWTPVYGRATLEAQIYYANDGEAPWPLEEPVVFSVSPAVKADGEFMVVDSTWDLISKLTYTERLAQALAEEITGGLQNDVFEEGAGDFARTACGCKRSPAPLAN